MDIELVIGMAVGAHVIWHNVHRCHFVLLLPLHAPILEPDLDLSLRQAERVRDLDASPACQVAIEVEFLLKFQCLIAGV